MTSKDPLQKAQNEALADMAKLLQNRPRPAFEPEPPHPNTPRTVELRMEMIDPDNKKVGSRAIIDEQVLIIADDPRQVLFKYLQEMAYKMIGEAFPTE